MVDVAVVGSGPAGAAVSAACAQQGLNTVLIAPDPQAPWRATYAAWADELPADLPGAVRSATLPEVQVIGTRPNRVRRPYVVLDNAALAHHLRHPAVTTRSGLATALQAGPRGTTVRLADGSSMTAAVVIDASGESRVLSGGPPRPGRAEQTAVGVVLPAETARPMLGDAAGILMDWRWPPSDAIAAPSFLYVVPLNADTVLVEETSLAQRPGMPLALLRRRLQARLAAHGVSVREAIRDEQVRIPLDTPLPPRGPVVAFGTAAALQHPATGYSVATSLALAPRVAAAIAEQLTNEPAAAAAAARRIVWNPQARAVRALRLRGLAVLLALPPARLPMFFDSFFDLSDGQRRAYLSERENMAGVTAAMTWLFAAVPWSVRVRMLAPRAGRRRPWHGG